MMTSSVKAVASIFFISLLGIPAVYIVNKAHTTQGEFGLFVAGSLCLTAICVLTYIALASFEQSKDWLFYGWYLFFITAVETFHFEIMWISIDSSFNKAKLEFGACSCLHKQQPSLC